jgi:predicted HTH domain antitoxin
MPSVSFETQEDTLRAIGTRLLEAEITRPSPFLLELVVKGVERKLMELYQQFQQGECSLGYLAEQLGISPWEAVHLLEERGLRVTNL